MELGQLRVTRRTNLRTLLGSTAVAGALTAAPQLARVALAGHTPTHIALNFESALGSFVGAFDVQRFAVQGGQLVAIGQLTGTVRDALGNIIGSVDQALTLPVNLAQSSGTCEILHLVLGPLDLNLLGLRVELSQIDLRITAQRGPGNLLGNLLCAIAGLLDGGRVDLQGLARLLNQLLRLLG